MRRMLSQVSLRQLGRTESMADEDEFKKYQTIMAAKKTRKTERNKPGKVKDRLLRFIHRQYTVTKNVHVPLKFFTSFIFWIDRPR